MPFTAPIRAITLDLDDTLWPSRPVLLHAEQALTAWLREHAPATLAAMTPQRRRELREGLLAEHPRRSHDVSFLRRESLRHAMRAAGDDHRRADEAFEVFLAARQQVTLYDDVAPVLTRWATRYRVIALTNGNADVARVGLGAYFHAVVAAHEFDVGKPDPLIFLHACRAAGVEPAEVLHVGDDLELDVLAARAAGLQAAWVRRPDLAVKDTMVAHATNEPRVFDSLQAVDRALILTPSAPSSPAMPSRC